MDDKAMVIVSNNGKSYQYENSPIRVEDNVLVYKGTEEKSGYVVSILKVDGDKMGNQAVEGFRREIKMLLGVNHNNLLKSLDIIAINKDNAPEGATHGFYLVNEYTDGIILSDVINRGTTNGVAQQFINLYKTDPYIFAKYIVKNVLMGVMELHNHGIYLKEIDPSCILITPTKEVKINWCLLLMKRYKESLSCNSLEMGCNMFNQYTAPELYDDRGIHNHNVDYYAIGILFFQLITGHLPFDDSMLIKPNEEIPLKDISNPKVRKVIKQATDKNPDNRFRSAREFIDAIDNIEQPNYHFSIEPFFSRLTKAFSRFGKTIKEQNDSVNISEITNIHSNTQKENAIVSKKYDINSSALTIRFGNILESNAEVVVSSDDSTLSMSGGVSEAIASMGGNMIKKDAKKNIPVQLGDMIITTAGELRQKYIFHCATIDYENDAKQKQDKKGFQEYIIRRLVDKCLRMMPLLGIKSIAFPTLGAGVANFSLEEIAICMTDVITDFLYSTNKEYHIEICLYDRLKQKNIMDYMTFFENIAVNIDRKKEINTKKEEMNMEGNVEIEENQIQPLGTLAAITPQDEHKVFISYSRKDIGIARIFCNMMDELGISYWIDVNGKYSGNNFKEVLVDAIDSSQMMVFFSSINSNQSPFVIKEISLAVAGKKKILPIKLDDAPYAKSIRFDLSDIDWIEFTKDKPEEAKEKFRYCLQLYLQ